MSTDLEEDPWGEPAVSREQIVCLLRRHFPEADSTQIEEEAKSLNFGWSYAVAMQTIDRSNRPSEKDVGDIRKAVKALKRAQKLIRELGSFGGKALIEAAHRAATFDGDAFGAYRPTASDATKEVANQLSHIIRDCESFLANINLEASSPDRGGRPRNIEASVFAEKLCLCFERFTGKAPTLATNNLTGEKYGAGLDFVREAFRLFRFRGSEEDLIRAATTRGKTAQKK